MSKIAGLKLLFVLAGLAGATWTVYHFFFAGKKAAAGSGSGSGSSAGSGSGSTKPPAGGSTTPPAGGSTTPPASSNVPTVTQYNNLKVGDKLYAVTTTYLYTDPNFSAASGIVVCQPGEWVGKVISANGITKKVENKAVRWGVNSPNANLTEFYIPIKAYTVNNG